MPFDITYVQERGPQAMPFDAYAVRAQAEFMRLLVSDPAENQVQEFLERNPAFLPGARTPTGNSGHLPEHLALVSQPLLPGLKTKRPDFMWIAQHSMTWFPTLIEIESLSKRLFTQKGEPTSEVTQARNQLAQWRIWFNSPENVAVFIKENCQGSFHLPFRGHTRRLAAFGDLTPLPNIADRRERNCSFKSVTFSYSGTL